jgi:hypothetical protein
LAYTSIVVLKRAEVRLQQDEDQHQHERDEERESRGCLGEVLELPAPVEHVALGDDVRGGDGGLGVGDERRDVSPADVGLDGEAPLPALVADLERPLLDRHVGDLVERHGPAARPATRGSPHARLVGTHLGARTAPAPRTAAVPSPPG